MKYNTIPGERDVKVCYYFHTLEYIIENILF